MKPEPVTYIARVLQSAPIFSSVGNKLLEQMAQSAILVMLEPGRPLWLSGDRADAVFVVSEGVLATFVADIEGIDRNVRTTKAGDVMGEVQLLTGGARIATVRAMTRSVLVRLERSDLDQAVNTHPELLERVTELIIRRLQQQELLRALENFLGDNPVVLSDALQHAQWMSLSRGSVLMRKGDPATDCYLVLTGALVALADAEADMPRVLGTIRPGETVGEMELLTSVPLAGRTRSSTVIACQASQVVRFDMTYFEGLLLSAPKSLLGVCRNLVERSQAHAKPKPTEELIVGIIADSPREQLACVTTRLQRALDRFAPTEVLTLDRIREIGLLSAPETLNANHPAWMRLSAWLEDHRKASKHIILVAQIGDGDWAQRVIAMAHTVLFLVDPSDEPAVNDFETALFSNLSGKPWEPSIQLLLAHPAETLLPSGTKNWLSPRRLDAHHHVRIDRQDDFDRVARLLTGRAVGLALSGGGARGFAHLGVLSALLDARIPIDRLTGTSFGALIAALAAHGRPLSTLATIASGAINAYGAPFGDYAFPMMAMLRSRRLSSGIQRMFGDVYLEDLWLPCSIVTTNLSTAKRQVFDRGLLWPRALASASPPVVTLPIAIDGVFHCDGGVTDNLPVSVLKEQHCRWVLASHVGTVPRFGLAEKAFPSPWAMIWDRVACSGNNTRQFPTLFEILLRVTTLSSDGRLDEIQSECDLFFEPEVGKLPLLDFTKPGPAIEAGCEHAREVLRTSPMAAEILAKV